jgi:hypothetical protein
MASPASAAGAASPVAAAVTPWRLLTRHFISRLFDNDLLSPDADAHRGASLGLASLLSISAFVSVLSGARFIMTPFPMPAMNAVAAIDDALLFVSLSMILLALVAVVAWDGLALDVRDEAILGPLPIPRITIVSAKLAAMGALAGAVLLALNGPSSVLHAIAVVAQLPASATGGLRLILAHAIACGAAGAFGFCTVLALREVCRAALGPWWPAVSTRLQALLIVVLATTLLLMPGWMGGVARRLAPSAADGRTVAASPPMWFVGLHQVLGGRVVVDIRARPLPPRVQADENRWKALFDEAQPGTAPLARTALAALVTSCAVAVLAFLWNARRPAARARTPQRASASRRSLWARAITATIARTPAVQAGFFFAMRTFARSVPHRAALAVASAFGLAVATIGFGRATRAHVADAAIMDLLWTQTMFIACLLAGCEQAIRLPAHLPASWSVKLAWPGDARGYVDGVKRAMVLGIGAPALALLLLAQLWFVPLRLALPQFAVGLLVMIIAIEARFIVEHPLPFLTSYVTGSRAKVAPVWFGLALIVSTVVASIEVSALERAASAAWLFAILVAIWATLAWLGRRAGAPREDDLDLFQGRLDEATQLKL